MVGPAEDRDRAGLSDFQVPLSLLKGSDDIVVGGLGSFLLAHLIGSHDPFFVEFVGFGPAGIHCYDMEGEKLWSKDLGQFPGDWGVAASPVILGDQVIQNCDAIGPSRLVSLDKATGNIIWETKREDKPRGGWSTPVFIETKGPPQLVLNGEFGAKGYDPAKGKELWFCKSFNGRGSPVPFHANGLIYQHQHFSF